MANNIVTADFLVPSDIVASTTATGYRATDVLLDTKPDRVWRSTSASGQTLDVDFGVDVTIAGIYANQANFTTCTYHAGATQGALTDSLGARTLYFEELTGRYKGLHKVTMSTPRRWLRLAISGVLGGDAFAELGALTFVTAAGMTPLGYSYGWPEYGQPQALSRLAVASEVSAVGRPFFRCRLGQPHINRGTSDANQTAHRNFARIGKVVPHLLSENRDLDSDGTCRLAWLVVIDDDEPVHGQTKPTFSPESFVVREVIE